MLPDLIVPVDRLPLLPSGKPDRLTAAILAAGEPDRQAPDQPSAKDPGNTRASS
jgi:hypothetical protein